MINGAYGPYPRNRIYSYRECADDYAFVPVARFAGAGSRGRQTVIGECDAPGLGDYFLLKTYP